MSEEHLERAPITEALLDIRAELSSGVDIAKLEDLYERVASSYPKRSKRFQFKAEINPEKQTVAQSHEQVGFFFASGDGTQVMQARLDGFSLSRLRPYRDWQHLRDEARRLWVLYAEVTAPTKITRLALRYINRINVPKQAPFEDYLRTFPRLGPDCPQTMSGLFMRVVAPDSRATVVISEAIDEAGVTDEHVPVILDIDTFRNVQLAPAEIDESWRIFEVLRKMKNQVFFGSLTEKALGQYR